MRHISSHGFQSMAPKRAPTIPHGKSKSTLSSSSALSSQKRRDMYNKVVRVEGHDASHAVFFFVLHYVPHLHWCHLAPMRKDGIFPAVSRLGSAHPHAGKARWRLVPEGQSRELDVSAERCILVRRYVRATCVCVCDMCVYVRQCAQVYTLG